MSRRLIFLLYGIAIGMFWAAVLNHATANGLVASIVWNVVLATYFGFFGWCWARATWEIPRIPLAVALPWVPFVFLVSLFGVAVCFLMIAAMWPFLALRHMQSQRRFRKLMKSKGRFITANDLRPKLDDGIGTLIVECHIKGPFRIWWTEDDLSSLGSPLSTREELMAFYEGREHPFNTRCLKEYLDDETGAASFTSLPASHARSEKLARTFPSMKVVRVIRPFADPPNVQAESKEQPDDE
jgi:hypothetical protein